MPIFNPSKRPYRNIWSPIAATVFIALTSTLLGCSQPAPSAELFPLAAGHHWAYRVITTSYLMQRHNEFPREIRHSHPKLPMTYTIDALNQKISTLAGDFDHCVLVKGLAQVRLYIDPVAGWKDVPLHTREWYCPGVGLVKLVREELTSAQFLTGGTQTMELQTWH